MINLTDVGDGNFHNYVLQRDLRDLDGKIETRFKIDVNNTGASGQFDGLFISLEEPGPSVDSEIRLEFSSTKDESFATTIFRFKDTTGIERSFGLSDDERLFDNTWYRLVINYNFIKSTIRWTLNFDNLTRVFRYNFFEISGGYRPAIFDEQSIIIKFRNNARTSGAALENLIDFVKAPFKEREWIQTDTPSDGDWLEDSWDFSKATDDIDDESQWQIAVPFLDSISGIMTVNTTNNSDLSHTFTEIIQLSFTVSGVDWDDGDLHELLKIYVQITHVGPNYITQIIIKKDGNIVENVGLGTSGAHNYNPKCSFSISLKEDRSVIGIKARAWADIENIDNFVDIVADYSFLGDYPDLSQEFVIETKHHMEFVASTFPGADSLVATMLFEDFGFYDRDIFIEVVKAIVDPIGNFISDIFIIAFRFLASIFRIVGDIITAAISIGVGLIQTSIGLVVGAVEAVGIILADILTALGELAADIAIAVWDGIGDALDFITDAIAEIAVQIWTEVSAFVEDILDDLINALVILASDVADVIFDILDFLIVLVLDLIDGVIDFIITATFFIWDLLGLPDLIAIYDTVILGLIQVATSTPDMFIWLLDVWFFWATGIFFLGFLLLLGFPIVSSSSPGELINNFRDMNSMDATLGLSIIGFQIAIPIGFVFWPTFFLMFLTPLL